MKPDNPNKNQGISDDDNVNHVEKWKFTTVTFYSFAVLKNKQIMLSKTNGFNSSSFLFHILYILLTIKIVQNYKNTWQKY